MHAKTVLLAVKMRKYEVNKMYTKLFAVIKIP